MVLPLPPPSDGAREVASRGFVARGKMLKQTRLSVLVVGSKRYIGLLLLCGSRIDSLGGTVTRAMPVVDRHEVSAVIAQPHRDMLMTKIRRMSFLNIFEPRMTIDTSVENTFNDE